MSTSSPCLPTLLNSPKLPFMSLSATLGQTPHPPFEPRTDL